MKQNPFDSIRDDFDFAIGVFFVSIIAANLVAFSFGNSDAFQRLGGYWIACALLAFVGLKSLLLLTRLGLEGKIDLSPENEAKIKAITFADEKGWLNYMDDRGQVYETPLMKREEIAQELRRVDDGLSPFFMIAELLIVSFATLQSSYGDWLFCAVHGWDSDRCFTTGVAG
ncbi:hypothetical protein [Roseibaca sp. Y0-43]|uniref:hypothetical protein n=1 Tax=Roseibaca sp. Y0-43 TaxID=2816854 RepID=UPI001D0C94BE|nr:hypothetical protein [Roseibaca sp. Y0-43]MCC1480339.1 hypothetical protein [Roseibaca sp. Y0-43]